MGETSLRDPRDGFVLLMRAKRVLGVYAKGDVRVTDYLQPGEWTTKYPPFLAELLPVFHAIPGDW